MSPLAIKKKDDECLYGALWRRVVHPIKKIHGHGEGAQNAIERREPPPGRGG